ncbi:DoxX family protein [Nocardia miyunensis]|uniref:DoxX family protein n=1 Tax=Nocardia miyunensis TaxID=282684 RepID=UPI00083242C8|nr:DoxX family protein [Nocardia miyunensis]
MTDKPYASSESNTPGRLGEPARSPYDGPTGEFPTVKATPGSDVPRTEDELGLDPDVPAAGGSSAEPYTTGQYESVGIGRYEAAGSQLPGADRDVPESDPTAPTYSFATIPPAPSGDGTPRKRLARTDTRRGTQDLGLLVLRLVIGLTFLYHGLQKLAGWPSGPGLNGTHEMLSSGGWKHVELSASMLTVAEVGGGILIILGLATPLAAGAVLASISDAWLWKQGMSSGFEYKTVELESILAGLAAALILTGPGRLSFDRSRGWATRPRYGSFAALVLALIAAAAAWFYLHGGNPFHGIHR